MDQMIDATVYSRAARWMEAEKERLKAEASDRPEARTLPDLKVLKEEQGNAFAEMEERLEKARRASGGAGK